MTQHIIALETPTSGRVELIAAFNPRLCDVFVNYFGDKCEFATDRDLAIEDIPKVLCVKPQAHLPATVFEGVRNDIADFRLGAIDVARRLFVYERDGTCIESNRW